MKYIVNDVVYSKPVGKAKAFCGVVKLVGKDCYRVRAYDGTEWERTEAQLGREA